MNKNQSFTEWGTTENGPLWPQCSTEGWSLVSCKSSDLRPQHGAAYIDEATKLKACNFLQQQSSLFVSTDHRAWQISLIAVISLYKLYSILQQKLYAALAIYIVYICFDEKFFLQTNVGYNYSKLILNRR